MTAIARRRAEALGLRNVRARDLDLEQIDEPDASYDVVLCREGLMLVPDPARAAREIAAGAAARRPRRARGLGAAGANPWLGVVFDAVSAQLGSPVPPPGIPGRSRSTIPAGSRGSSRRGAFRREVRELPTPYRAASVEEWWTRTAALAGPLASGSPRCRRRRRMPSSPAPAAAIERLRDAGRTRDPGALADRGRHPCRALERARLTGAADEQPEADGYGTDGTWSTEL